MDLSFGSFYWKNPITGNLEFMFGKKTGKGDKFNFFYHETASFSEKLYGDTLGLIAPYAKFNTQVIKMPHPSQKTQIKTPQGELHKVYYINIAYNPWLAKSLNQFKAYLDQCPQIAQSCAKYPYSVYTDYSVFTGQQVMEMIKTKKFTDRCLEALANFPKILMTLGENLSPPILNPPTAKEITAMKMIIAKIKNKKAKNIPDKTDTNYLNTLRDIHKAYYAGLKPQYQQAVAYYTGSGYSVMNNYLRGLIPSNQVAGYGLTEETLKTYINNLNQVLNNAPVTTQPIIVYRGVKFDAMAKFHNLKPGQVIDIFRDSFNSTSFNMNVSAGGYFAGNKCCVFTVHLPVGVKGLYIGKQSSVSGEDEFILAPGPLFRVMKFKHEKVPQTNVVMGKPNLKFYHLFCVDCEQAYQKYNNIVYYNVVGPAVAVSKTPTKGEYVSPKHSPIDTAGQITAKKVEYEKTHNIKDEPKTMVEFSKFVTKVPQTPTVANKTVANKVQKPYKTTVNPPMPFVPLQPPKLGLYQTKWQGGNLVLLEDSVTNFGKQMKIDQWPPATGYGSQNLQSGKILPQTPHFYGYIGATNILGELKSSPSFQYSTDVLTYLSIPPPSLLSFLTAANIAQIWEQAKKEFTEWDPTKPKWSEVHVYKFDNWSLFKPQGIYSEKWPVLKIDDIAQQLNVGKLKPDTAHFFGCRNATGQLSLYYSSEIPVLYPDAIPGPDKNSIILAQARMEYETSKYAQLPQMPLPPFPQPLAVPAPKLGKGNWTTQQSFPIDKADLADGVLKTETWPTIANGQDFAQVAVKLTNGQLNPMTPNFYGINYLPGAGTYYLFYSSNLSKVKTMTKATKQKLIAKAKAEFQALAVPPPVNKIPIKKKGSWDQFLTVSFSEDPTKIFSVVEANTGLTQDIKDAIPTDLESGKLQPQTTNFYGYPSQNGSVYFIYYKKDPTVDLSSWSKSEINAIMLSKAKLEYVQLNKTVGETGNIEWNYFPIIPSEDPTGIFKAIKDSAPVFVDIFQIEKDLTTGKLKPQTANFYVVYSSINDTYWFYHKPDPTIDPSMDGWEQDHIMFEKAKKEFTELNQKQSGKIPLKKKSQWKYFTFNESKDHFKIFSSHFGVIKANIQQDSKTEIKQKLVNGTITPQTPNFYGYYDPNDQLHHIYYKVDPVMDSDPQQLTNAMMLAKAKKLVKVKMLAKAKKEYMGLNQKNPVNIPIKSPVKSPVKIPNINKSYLQGLPPQVVDEVAKLAQGCGENKIKNPVTKKCVNIDGQVGKKVIKDLQAKIPIVPIPKSPQTVVKPEITQNDMIPFIFVQNKLPEFNQTKQDNSGLDPQYYQDLPEEVINKLKTMNVGCPLNSIKSAKTDKCVKINGNTGKQIIKELIAELKLNQSEKIPTEPKKIPLTPKKIPLEPKNVLPAPKKIPVKVKTAEETIKPIQFNLGDDLLADLSEIKIANIEEKYWKGLSSSTLLKLQKLAKNCGQNTFLNWKTGNCVGVAGVLGKKLLKELPTVDISL
jgi:hypothetical protein